MTDEEADALFHLSRNHRRIDVSVGDRLVARGLAERVRDGVYVITDAGALALARSIGFAWPT